MRVRYAGRTRSGTALELPPGVEESEVLRAIRAGDAGSLDGPRPAIEIECAAPGPGHARLCTPASPPTGVVGLLAAAARSRGLVTDHRAELSEIRATLSDCTPADEDAADARRAVAETGAAVERLRERVAAVRGRLQARRATDASVEEVAAELTDAIARLSEAETERVAAEQSLEVAERRARESRTRRERRLRLEDRADNLARAARRELADRVHDRFAAALEAVPGAGAVGDRPGSYDGDRVTAALAAVRVADLEAPVVDDTGRFESAAAAADALGVPVLGRSLK